MPESGGRTDSRGAMVANLKAGWAIAATILALRTVGLVFLPVMGAARESQLFLMDPFTPFDSVRVAIGLGVIPLYGYWRRRLLSSMEWTILAVAGVHSALPLSAMNGLISWPDFMAYHVVDWLVIFLVLVLITLALRRRMRLHVSSD